MKRIKIILLCLLPLQLASCTSDNDCKRSSGEEIALIPAENFQKKIDGKQVGLYTLKNDNGMTVQVTNYGTRVVSLWVPDKEGKFRDVVLGCNTIDQYLTSTERFYGATVGRFGNRIADGKFTLDGVTYQLDTNHDGNHLHGGSKGFYEVIWEAEPYRTETGDEAIRFTYLSPDGEMGYPGNANVTARIILCKNKNEIRFQYEATTDAPTVINLVHHSYFNLTGEGSGTVLDHFLKINSSFYTPNNDRLIPTGEIISVENTPLDFRTYHRIGERIEEQHEALIRGNGYDQNWVASDAPDNEKAAIYSPESGIRMAMSSNEPGIMFYSGNFITGKDTGKSGKPHLFRSAFCLQAEKYPDSPNHPHFPSVVLRPGETYTSWCHYTFDVTRD